MQASDSLIVSLVLYALMLGVVFFSIRRRRTLKNFAKEVSLKKPVLVRELQVAFMYAAFLIVASITVAAVFYAAGYQADLQKVSQTVKAVPLGSLVIIITAASVVEEVFFRGFLQTRTSLLFASFTFAYFHIIYGSFAEMVGAFILGFILGKEFQHTRSLFAPIVSHWAYNMVTLAVVFSFP